MRTPLLRAALALPVLLMAVTVGGALSRADAQSAPSSQPSPVAEDALRQIELTAKQIEGLLAAQKPIEDFMAKIPEDKRDQLDAKAEAELDKIAQQFGFKDYGEYDDVGANVSFILEGFDPQTKTFVGQDTLLKREMAEVAKDKSMSPRDRDAQLKEMKAALAAIDPVKFPGNIALVTKSYDKLAAALGQ